MLHTSLKLNSFGKHNCQKCAVLQVSNCTFKICLHHLLFLYFGVYSCTLCKKGQIHCFYKKAFLLRTFIRAIFHLYSTVDPLFVCHKPLPFPFAHPWCFGEGELVWSWREAPMGFYFFPPVCVPLTRGVNIERAPHTEE